jgi:hypothetical protein
MMAISLSKRCCWYRKLLPRQCGRPANIVQYFGANGATDTANVNLFAGADLQWVLTGMDNEGKMDSDAEVMAATDVLVSAEVEVGLMQAAECESSSDGLDGVSAEQNPGIGDSLECAP